MNLIRAGYLELDELLQGGFKKGDLVVLAGRPGIGKTNFVLSILTHHVDISCQCLYFSLDENKKLIQQKLGLLTPVVNLEIDDKTQNIDEIIEKCKVVKQEKGLGLVVVDYVQLVMTSNTIKTKENQHLEISNIANRLKQLAQELNLVIILLSQISRSVEKHANKRPTLQDLNYLEQSADVILTLYNPDLAKEILLNN